MSDPEHLRRSSTPPPPPRKSMYRRTLPSPAIAFASEEGRRIFKEAMQEGTMECFFRIGEAFHTQDEPAFCGLATLVMVLNALSVDPGRVWKGSWRWYHEGLLDCCKPLDKVEKEGIQWDEWCCLARCQGLDVTPERAADADGCDRFRAEMARVCADEGHVALVVSYNRKALHQTGTGHFSPVGGYHAGRDLALIMDSARFKYPPHWVPLETLYTAMQDVDEATGKPRGYAVLQRSAMLHPLHASQGFSLGLAPQRAEHITATMSAWQHHTAAKVAGPTESARDAEARLQAFVRALPKDTHTLVAVHDLPGDDGEGMTARLQALRGSRLYEVVRSAFPITTASTTAMAEAVADALALSVAVLLRAGVGEGPAMPQDDAWRGPLVGAGETLETEGAALEAELLGLLDADIDTMVWQVAPMRGALRLGGRLIAWAPPCGVAGAAGV